MKFKLVEKFDETRSVVQEYMYDAIDELNNASLEEYIQWFKSELTYYDDDVERAVTDAYIEACDYGMIKGVEKTRLTSELKEYIESHTDIIDDTDELMKQCPDHLQHELKIVLSKLDESLNEELLTEKMWVKVSDGYRAEPFYFYATEKDTQTDVNTLLPIITGTQKGTYKQQLNKNIVKELSNNYKKSLKDNVPYVLGFERSVTEQELKDNKDNIITLTDRSLRRAAQDEIFKDSNMNDKDWLIHHRKIGEYNNDLDNIVLIGRGPSGSVQDAVAHAIHKVLEAQKAKIATGSFIVPIKQHNGDDWVQTNTIEVTIK